ASLSSGRIDYFSPNLSCAINVGSFPATIRLIELFSHFGLLLKNIDKCSVAKRAAHVPTTPQTETLTMPADSIRTTTIAALDATYEASDAAERALALVSEALAAETDEALRADLIDRAQALTVFTDLLTYCDTTTGGDIGVATAAAEVPRAAALETAA